jgi:ABC-type dipeptide/oligopeptide/nickel transport system permease subunit
MLADGARVIEVAWWLMVFPGLFLLFTTLAFNLVGDGLRDALDPRTRR